MLRGNLQAFLRVPRLLVPTKGGCLHGATFVLAIPTLIPDLPSPRGAPQVDQSGPKPSLQSTLHKEKWRISTSMCIIMLMHWLINNLFPSLRSSQ